MTAKTAFVFLACFTSTGALAGCSGSGSSGSADPDPSTVRASLHRAKGCGDLLGDFKSDAKYKVNRGINKQIESINKCIAAVGDANCAYAAYGGYGYGGRGEALPSDSAAGSSSSSTGGAPTSAPTGGASSSDSNSSASSHSDTNTQVKGVDEADIVKTDGASLFILHGNALKVVKAWPASDLKESTSTEIEGYPSEMFVNDGKAVVYSTVNGAAIFAAAGVTPKDAYYDWGYGYSGVETAVAPYYPGGYYDSGPYVPLTKVTVLDLAGATPTVAREMYFEGGYLDARRVDDHVRTVLTGAAHGPKLIYGVYELYPQDPNTGGYDVPVGSSTSSSSGGSSGTTTTNPYPQTGTAMIAALEQMRSKNLASIDASVLNDWLPYTFVKNGGAVQAKTVACEDFYMPSLGSSDAGLTEVVSFDLKNPTALPKETAIAAAADTVYGSADTLYLASRAWIEPPFAWQYYATGGGSSSGGSGTVASPPSTGTATPVPAPEPGTKSLKIRNSPTQGPVIAWSNEKTHVHKFEFKTDATFPNYLASGTVVGAIKDQFSMDDKDGYLRISTTENRSYFDLNGQYVYSDSTSTTQPNSVNHLFVLGQTGTWLDKVGDAGELAANESIYSTRFVGGRGYITTFRQVDPLFVFDLNDPKNPTKLGELTIPGFSEYMHPLDDTHLLTIGRDASSTGQARALQLRIFDVSNGAAPKVAQQFTYNGTDYSGSDAEYDHKAFTYFEEKKLLAFPFYSYGQTGSTSTLEVFSVDAGVGFTKVGSVDSSTLISKAPQGYCGGYYAPSVRRGVFLENWVYSVSYAGIVAKDASNFAGAAFSAPLSDPQTNQGYGPVCAYAD